MEEFVRFMLPVPVPGVIAVVGLVPDDVDIFDIPQRADPAVLLERTAVP